MKIIPSKEQLISAIASGVDNRNNVLILNVNGKYSLVDFEAINISDDNPGMVARSETFAAGNDFVGYEASQDKSHIDDLYNKTLECWIIYLKKNKTNLLADDMMRHRNTSEILDELQRIEFENMQYPCPSCGKTHTDWPALGYSSPDNYANLSQGEKDSIAKLTTDFCTINYPDENDRFIRVVMTQKVNDHCEDLEYGFWVSLSEKSFNDYKENYNKQNYETQYFGWLCNDIPQYDFPDSIPTTVVTQPNGLRPEIFPHEDFDHPFVKDYYNGITKEEAEKG